MSTTESLKVENLTEKSFDSNKSKEKTSDNYDKKDSSAENSKKSFHFTNCEVEGNTPNPCVKKKSNYSERVMLYKKPISKDNLRLEVDFDDTPQEVRRHKLLEHQKKCRDALINEKRGLIEIILDEKNEEEMEEAEMAEEAEGMECEVIKQKRRRKKNKYYAGLAQLSEWMFDVPQDFIENWIMVPCPVGQRCLIIASKGSTKVFTRKGFFMVKFQSALPGGNKRFSGDCTILDCILSKSDKTYYILDVLALANHETVNCDAEFRFYWLKEKIHELVGLNNGVYKFIPLPTVSCRNDFYEFLDNLPDSIVLDGILFFHKESNYTHGRTPLVTWLKSYMLPEVLGINIPEKFSAKPENYIDFQTHILHVKEHQKQILMEMEQRKCKSLNNSEAESIADPLDEPELEAME